MSHRVQVVVRLRPLNNTETEAGGNPCVKVATNTELDLANFSDPHRPSRPFTFDSIFAPAATQTDVYEALGKPIVQNVLKGYNGTVLAYGQTGSGKTHSMLGPAGGTVDVLNKSSPHYKDRGILPRLVDELFTSLEQLVPEEVTWKVHTSVFELYKENIQDLLGRNFDEGGGGAHIEYKIREDTITGRGIYVENLYAKPCQSASEVFEALRVANGRRKVASTKSNETSSRSHSITLISVDQINHVKDNSITSARLNIVDLAGSEKIAKTQATGDRLKEAQTINLSLTLLGNVIYKLTDGKSVYIPYRDSKLTRILQESFGGNSCTTLLCHASTADYNREETASTLKFAGRAKMIKNKPRINRELSTKELQLAYTQAMEEIRVLKDRLALAEEQIARGHHIAVTASGNPSPIKSARNRTTEPSPEEVLDELKQQQENEAAESDQLRMTIAALMKEIDELKKDLFGKQENLDTANSQVEFYKKRSQTLEEELQDALGKLKRQDQIFQRKLLDLQTANACNAVLKGGGDGLSISGSSTGIVKQGSSGAIKTRTLNSRESSDIGAQQQGRTSQGGIRRNSSGGNVRGGKPPQQRQTLANNELGAMMGGTPISIATPPTATSGAKSQVLTTPQTLETLDGIPPPVSSLSKEEEGKKQKEEQDKKENYELDLLLKIESLEKQLHTSKKEAKELSVTNKDLTTTNSRLSSRLDDVIGEKDALEKELDGLKKVLAMTEQRNGDMKRILDALNIDIEEQLSQLGIERAKNDDLSHQTDKLKAYTSHLEQVGEQQDYCDIAAMELIVKSEDMDAVEREIEMLHYQPVSDHIFAGTRHSALSTISQLENFLEKMMGTLRGQKFATANLEAQRLNLVMESTELLARCSAGKELLDN